MNSKVLMKTQSLVVSTSNLAKGLNSGRNRMASKSREENEPKKRHLQSIVIEPKHRRDVSSDFNPKHHQSVVVFKSHGSRNFIGAEAIGPQKTKTQLQANQKV